MKSSEKIDYLIYLIWIITFVFIFIVGFLFGKYNAEIIKGLRPFWNGLGTLGSLGTFFNFVFLLLDRRRNEKRKQEVRKSVLDAYKKITNEKIFKDDDDLIVFKINVSYMVENAQSLFLKKIAMYLMDIVQKEDKWNDDLRKNCQGVIGVLKKEIIDPKNVILKKNYVLLRAFLFYPQKEVRQCTSLQSIPSLALVGLNGDPF